MKRDVDFEAFFKANERRIHFQIHRLGISGDWYSEFYTEGIFALWKAYKEYESAKGEVGTFLNYQIRYRLIDLMRKKIREEGYKNVKKPQMQYRIRSLKKRVGEFFYLF